MAFVLVEKPRPHVTLVTLNRPERMNAMAFDRNKIPMQARLNAIFASDIGHWDVPDFREVLPEAWELMEDGHLDASDFRAFTCDNAIGLLAGSRSNFFEGTVVEDYAKKALAQSTD